ncbi:hypothetical protein OIV83_002771 [Microbotryomycetes sp. JL201]|nr:hypothetical protein OIV83_002771 [Microbotryomycetes sp. JL201]
MATVATSSKEATPVSMARPVKLLPKNHPSPLVGAKFKQTTTFVDSYRAYQWTQGYDAIASFPDKDTVQLRCTDKDTFGCPFSVIAKKFTFESGEFAGRSGFVVVADRFDSDHNHDAPYTPVDLRVENARRVQMQANDPALEHPPTLVRKEQTELTIEGFLYKIDPDMATEEVLTIFESEGLPRSTPASQLVALTGQGVLDLFRESLSELPLFFGFRVMAAIDRALERRAANPNAPLDPSLDKTSRDRCLARVQAIIDEIDDVKPVVS